jgi:NADH-quinone oxidoreductase subunit J
MEAIAFGIVAGLALISALAVVRSRDLVRAVLWLGVTLFSTAVLYAILGASFVAGVQVLLYVGGVVTLMIFGVMITRRHDNRAGERARGTTLDSTGSARAAAVALGLFASVTWAVLSTDGLDAPAMPPATSTADLGRALLHEHLLAFEVVSMLLLAAMIGAIVIARRSDPGAAKQPTPVRPPATHVPAEEAAQ